jgi:hypothetical protein
MQPDDDTPTEEVPELDEFDPAEIDDNPIFGSGAN